MKKFYFLVSIIALLIINCNNYAFSAPALLNDKSSKVVKPNPIFNKTVIVPIGQVLPISIGNAIDSKTLETADTLDAILKSDFYYKKILIAPEGSTVSATVTKNQKTDNDTVVQIKFTKITTPTNQDIPISAIFKNDDKAGLLHANNNGDVYYRENSNFEIIIMQPVTYTPR